MRYLVILCLFVVSTTVLAIEPELPNNPFHYLRDANVMRELELVPDQIHEMKTAQTKIIQAAQAAHENNPDISLSDRMQLTMDAQAEAIEKYNETVFSTVLLPHQVKRLKECVWQSAASHDLIGTMQKADLILPGEVAEKTTIYKKRQQDLAELVQRHRAETERLLLKDVSVSKQRQWRKLLGEDSRCRTYTVSMGRD